MKTVKPLLATRFKLGFNKAGNCTTFRKDQAEELEGAWVWLIEATDGMNDPLVSVADLEQVGSPDPWAPNLERDDVEFDHGDAR